MLPKFIAFEPCHTFLPIGLASHPPFGDEAAGVAEYWLIDRFRRILTVYRAGKAEQIVTEKERYTTPLLPGFELDLQKLLAAADRYSEGKRKR